MGKTAIEVENISKIYRLGSVNAVSFKDDISRLWAYITGQPDPAIQAARQNDRTNNNSSGYVWALKDVSFNIAKGDVVGVVGRNGAGKSTFLKILSKVTAPTTGTIKASGRIASLLEVGTGFHPELTGKENVYLNGHILGMTRHEINQRFDEIVDFAGVAMYLDTPVKRYSSGMYVRLAFAVAAHLEPEILIVDEVLAVGDAEFQKKCLGKMQSVNKESGRTIIFVSHQVNVLRALCKRALLLEQGTLKMDGDIDTVIDNYLLRNIETIHQITSEENSALIGETLEVLQANIHCDTMPLKINQEIHLNFVTKVKKNMTMHLSLVLKNNYGETIFNVLSNQADVLNNEIYKSTLIIPADLLNNSRYYVDLYFIDSNLIKPIFVVPDILIFDAEDTRDIEWTGVWTGAIRPKLNFTLK